MVVDKRAYGEEEDFSVCHNLLDFGSNNIIIASSSEDTYPGVDEAEQCLGTCRLESVHPVSGDLSGHGKSL